VLKDDELAKSIWDGSVKKFDIQGAVVSRKRRRPCGTSSIARSRRNAGDRTFCDAIKDGVGLNFYFSKRRNGLRWEQNWADTLPAPPPFPSTTSCPEKRFFIARDIVTSGRYPPSVHAHMRRLRWTTFALVIGAYILSFFHRVAPATIAADLQQTFQAGAAALGGVAATYFYIYTIMQVPTGVLVDTLGPRRIVTLGGLIGGAGSILFGLADSLYVLAAGRLLVGLGVSVTFVAALKLNAAWFHDRHFGISTGLTILLGNVGAVLGAAPLAWALDVVSWRTVFVAVGIASLVFAVLTWWRVRNHPGEAGLPSMRELDGHAAHPPHAGHWLEGLRSVVRNRATWPGFWVNLGLAGSYFAFAGLWAVPVLRDVYGMNRETATQHTSLLLIGFALGAFTVGGLSDRVGRRKPVLVGTGLLYLVCWIPFLLHLPLAAPWGHLLFLAMGIGASSFTLSWACVKEVNRHALSGMATSVANTGAFFGTGILQPLVGRTIDSAAAVRGGSAAIGADYDSGLLILFVFALLGVLAGLRLKETYCRYVTFP